MTAQLIADEDGSQLKLINGCQFDFDRFSGYSDHFQSSDRCSIFTQKLIAKGNVADCHLASGVDDGIEPLIGCSHLGEY